MKFYNEVMKGTVYTVSSRYCKPTGLLKVFRKSDLIKGLMSQCKYEVNIGDYYIMTSDRFVAGYLQAYSHRHFVLSIDHWRPERYPCYLKVSLKFRLYYFVNNNNIP